MKSSFVRRQEGQAIVMVALILGLVATGFLAFAIDAGTLFRDRQQAQIAADAVSVAAAQEIAAGNSATIEQNVAESIARLNGFDTTAGASVVLSTPASGDFTGSAYVQAKVSKPFKPVFLPKLGSFTISASSIGGGVASYPTCVCIDSSSSAALAMSNGSKISAPDCGIVNNSSSSQAITMVGGSSINALSLGTVSSTWDTGSNIYGGSTISASTKIIQGITNRCSVPAPAVPSYSSCLADPGADGGTVSVGPTTAGGVICYTSLTVGANAGVITLRPGIYVISNGYLHFEAGSGGKSNLGGQGVFFYLLGGGGLLIDNGANVNLVAGGNLESNGTTTAPSTGAYDGLLVYQPASNTTAMTIAGGATAFISGNVQAPSAAVTMNNGSASTVTSDIVAQTLTMSGGGTLNAVLNSTMGSTAVGSSKVVQ